MMSYTAQHSPAVQHREMRWRHYDKKFQGMLVTDCDGLPAPI